MFDAVETLVKKLRSRYDSCLQRNFPYTALCTGTGSVVSDLAGFEESIGTGFPGTGSPTAIVAGGVSKTGAGSIWTLSYLAGQRSITEKTLVYGE